MGIRAKEAERLARAFNAVHWGRYSIYGELGLSGVTRESLMEYWLGAVASVAADADNRASYARIEEYYTARLTSVMKSRLLRMMDLYGTPIYKDIHLDFLRIKAAVRKANGMIERFEPWDPEGKKLTAGGATVSEWLERNRKLVLNIAVYDMERPEIGWEAIPLSRAAREAMDEGLREAELLLIHSGYGLELFEHIVGALCCRNRVPMDNREALYLRKIFRHGALDVVGNPVEVIPLDLIRKFRSVDFYLVVDNVPLTEYSVLDVDLYSMANVAYAVKRTVALARSLEEGSAGSSDHVSEEEVYNEAVAVIKLLGILEADNPNTECGNLISKLTGEVEGGGD